MKFKLLALALLAALSVQAQKKTVTRNENGRSEKVTVSDKDKNILEGPYVRYANNSKVPIIEGFYHNNLKDSVWRFYNRNNVVAEGRYKNGEKVGVWTGYTRGYERLKYDFTTGQLVAYTPAAIDSSIHFKPVDNSVTATLERNPIYINGVQYFSDYFNSNVRYPSEALVNGKQGEAIVIFTIGASGVAGNYHLQQKLGYGMGDELLRVLSTMDGVWIPALINGKPAAAEAQVSVLFEINPPEDKAYKPYQIRVTAMSETVIR